MNLLEHYIEKVYRETDVTEKFGNHLGCSNNERYIDVEMDIDCYGARERVHKIFPESEWKEVKLNGYYMA